MKPLVDDELTTRPFSVVFYLLARSGQVQGHRLHRERMAKLAILIFYFIIVFGWGLWTGWMIWGGR